jgi:enoyl-CoA hydratase/carnithine racemase
MLPRLPGALGIFLGLTGTRLAGPDAVHAGIATHFVPRAELSSLAGVLPRDGVASVAVHALTLPPFSLAQHRAAIDRCFGVGSVAEIIARLQAEGTGWARETLATLRSMSPSSVLWSFEVMRRGARLSLADCLQMELKLTRHVTAHPDFAEGVRAMVVDKDRKPKWEPARIEDVPLKNIAAMFA